MLTLFHDFTSPASAVAVARLGRLAQAGLPVEFVGFEAVGVDVLLPVTLDVLADMDRLAEDAAAEGVTLRRPPGLPPTALAHVVGDVAAELGSAAEARWRSACYRAFWEEGADLSDRGVLARLGTVAELPEAAVAEAISDRLRLAAVRRRAGQRRRDGVGGVPTILTQRTLVPALLPDDDLWRLGRL